MRKTIALLISLISLSSVAMANSSADDTYTISTAIKNGSTYFESKTGETISDSFIIENQGLNGTFQIEIAETRDKVTDTKEYNDMPTWIKIKDDQSKFVIKKGEKKEIAFTISIPADAKKEALYRGTLLISKINAANESTQKVEGSSGASASIVIRRLKDFVVKVTDNPVAPKKGANSNNSNEEKKPNDNILYTVGLLLLLIITGSIVIFKKKK